MTTRSAPVDITEYFTKVDTVSEQVRRLPYGTQSQIAYDTRTAPTMISSVLGKKSVNPKVLAKIEDWLQLQGGDRSQAEAVTTE
jgi:hypothetical protein